MREFANMATCIVCNIRVRTTMKSTALACVVFVSITPLGNAQSLRETIDQRVEAGWKQNNISPAAAATDAEFLRRVSLDLTGLIPTYEQAVEFLDDSSPDKRAKLVDKLIADPRFGLHQADLWDMVYFGRNPPGFGTDKRDGFQTWLRDQFNNNTPYNEWVRSILKADGNTVEQGAPMFYVQYKSRPEDATEAITQKFLGIQLQCARCHDHPFNAWTQLDFYGMAAFVARLQIVDVGTKNKVKAYAIGEKNLGDVLFTGPAIDQAPGQKGEPVKPKFLNGEKLVESELPKDFEEPRNFPSGKVPPAPKFSRKNAMAEWITDPKNPYFAKAAVNRIWGQFMGKGIVHPVDNLDESNPPSHPELLDALTAGFIEHKFDVKWLIREIVNSKTYQLSSAGSVPDEMPLWYERARFRPLSAEELFESWITASAYDKVLEKSKQKPTGRFNVRSITWDYMRRYFGSPNDGSGNFQGGMHEHLFLNNGQVHTMISGSEGGLKHLIATSSDPMEKRVERMFVQVLSRRPSKEETARFVAHLSAEDDSEGRLHDAVWSLMTCSEFRFNH